MAMSLNGNTVLSSFGTRGIYHFSRQRVGGINGSGTPQAAGPQTVQWQFSHLTPTELAYFYTTVCGGALSVALTSATLLSDLMVETAFTSGVIYRPVWESYTAGLYRNVTITIDHLLPILS